MPHLHLGKHPVRYDRRTLQYHNYSRAVLAPPLAVNWHDGIVVWPNHLNVGDAGIGDCTIAAIDNLVGIWTANANSNPTWISDADTLTAYSAVSGYIPGNPATDNGAVMLDVLNYTRHTGVGGHSIYGYVEVPPQRTVLFRQAIWLMGGLYIGLDLPVTAAAQTVLGGRWQIVRPGSRAARPGSWGGHAMTLVAYDQRWYYGVPWGIVGVIRIDPAFLLRYCVEAYGVLSSQDWAAKTLAPNGFTLAALEHDLSLL